MPNEVKEALVYGSETFDRDDVKYLCVNEGDKGYENFYVVYCIRCVRDKLPFLFEKYKSHLPQQPKMEDLMDSWDRLMAIDKSIWSKTDYCGCILPNQLGVIAFPNNRQFIQRPIDHWNSHHKNDDSDVIIGKKRKQNEHEPSAQSFSKKSTNVIVSKSGLLSMYAKCTTTASNNKNVRITTTGSNLKLQTDVAQLLDPKVSLFVPAKDTVEEWSQNHATSVILSGVNKNLSQASIVGMYETSMRVAKGYHKAVLGDLQINGKKFLPPPRDTLNEHNISRVEHALLEAF